MLVSRCGRIVNVNPPISRYYEFSCTNEHALSGGTGESVSGVSSGRQVLPLSCRFQFAELVARNWRCVVSV